VLRCDRHACLLPPHSNAELIGYLGPHNEFDANRDLSSEEYWKFAFVRTSFESLDACEAGQAKWDPSGAKFRLDPAWMDMWREINNVRSDVPTRRQEDYMGLGT
jgi:hypothetical protein